MVDISGLNRAELKELLKKVKLLGSLRKSLGKRGIFEYNKIVNGKNFYRVEYFNSEYTNLSYIQEKSVIGFNRLFGLNLGKDDIEFVENKDLKGGIRLFLNDNMFDFSYQRFEKILL